MWIGIQTENNFVKEVQTFHSEKEAISFFEEIVKENIKKDFQNDFLDTKNDKVKSVVWFDNCGAECGFNVFEVKEEK